MFKKTMLVTCTAALAFAALPALAAADPVMKLPYNGHFTVTGGTAELEGSASVHCEEVTGTGEFTSSQTGTIEFTFHGCKGPFGISCTTSGQPTGTITTTGLTFHLKTVTEGTPAVLITSNEGHFATFSCSAFFNIKVVGNGIIGAVTKPGYESPSSTATIKFSGEEGKQGHTTVETGDETEYGLEASINGGEAAPAVEIAEGELHFTEGEGELQEHGVELTIHNTDHNEGAEGTVLSTPAGINCGPSCETETAIFVTNQVVTLHANPEAGSKFKGWSAEVGTCKGAAETCEVTMSKDLTLEATFE